MCAPVGVIARVANEAIATAVDAHPLRFVGMGTLPLQDTDAAIAELDWIVGAGMVGVELGSNVGGAYLGDPRFRPVWQAIADAGVAVFVHPVNVIGADRLGAYFLANLIGNPVETTRCIADVIFSGLLDDLPDLRVCFAHGGGAVSSLAGRWDHGFLKRLRARGQSRPPAERVSQVVLLRPHHTFVALSSLPHRSRRSRQSDDWFGLPVRHGTRRSRGVGRRRRRSHRDRTVAAHLGQRPQVPEVGDVTLDGRVAFVTGAGEGIGRGTRDRLGSAPDAI